MSGVSRGVEHRRRGDHGPTPGQPAERQSGRPRHVLPGSLERRPAIRVVPALLLIVGLWWGQAVLIPLVLSVLISYALEPFVSRLVRLHLPRPVAILVLLLAL